MNCFHVLTTQTHLIIYLRRWKHLKSPIRCCSEVYFCRKCVSTNYLEAATKKTRKTKACGSPGCASTLKDFRALIGNFSQPIKALAVSYEAFFSAPSFLTTKQPESMLDEPPPDIVSGQKGGMCEGERSVGPRKTSKSPDRKLKAKCS